MKYFNFNTQNWQTNDVLFLYILSSHNGMRKIESLSESEISISGYLYTSHLLPFHLFSIG